MENQDSKGLLTKKNIITFLVVILLLLAIPITVKLVQQQQQIKSKAAGDPITFTGPNISKDSSGQYVTTDPTVQVELNSPLGPPASQQ